MDILPGKPVYVYIANLTAKSVNLPKCMIVATAYNAPQCIIIANDDESCTMENEGQASMQSDSTISVHALHFKPRER